MGKILHTLNRNIQIFFENYFAVPTALTVVLLLITYFLILKKHGKTKHSICIILSASFFYLLELFYITLFSRIGTYTYPLADIFGEWSIYDGESSMYVNPRPILNIILFLPVCFVFSQLLKTFFNTDILKKLPVLKCTGISLGLSLIIELGQLLFALGTFQLSDLFYNTLGGLIGALIYCAAVKIVNKKRC